MGVRVCSVFSEAVVTALSMVLAIEISMRVARAVRGTVVVHSEVATDNLRIQVIVTLS